MSDPAKASDPRPNTVPWPPVLYALTLGAAFGLQKFWPLAPVVAAPLAYLLGLPLLISGIALGVAAIIRFRVIGTSFEPTAPATALATRGIYTWTRNPMYLGAVVAFFGLGLATGWTWLLVLNLILPFVLTRLAIVREEAYLESRFGDAYRAYKSTVRRWI